MRTFASAVGTLIASAFATGCHGAEAIGDAAVPTDSGEAHDVPAASDAPSLDAEMHDGLRLPRCEDTDPERAMALPHFASTLEGSYVPRVPRLAAAGPMNPVFEEGEAMYRALDHHVTDVGPGQPHVRREELGASSTATVGRRSLAWLAHLSDFQVVDDESPVRVANLDNPTIASGLRSQEAYLPRAVSAMSRTLTRVEVASRPFDFGIVTGDCIESAQRNELDWVISLMNGEPGLHTDSGDDDDPVPGPDNDPKDPFDPTPFPAPWFFVAGNHDLEVIGVNTPSDRRRAQALGDRATTGTRDYRLWYAPPTRGTVPADPRRALIERDDIVAALRAATGPEGPPGHGFAPTGAIDTSLGASWSVDVVPGLLRILALDTNDPDGGSNGMITRAQVDGRLIPELDRALDDGVLVMLASHHSALAIDVFPGQLGTEPREDALTTEEIESLIGSRAEVIAWLVGHDHLNRVRAVAGPDSAHPGYWEVMTASIADWPSQARMIELVDNGDGTLSIFGTLIDHDTDDCFERRFRALTQMEWSSAWAEPRTLEPIHRNVELVRAIPDSARGTVMAMSATAPDRLESLTSLRGE
jgi:3',5'-cyclic AMP phosphodiesterase CpdA